MLKTIGIVVLAVLAIILGLAATKPDTFAVTRTVTIKAPPEKIHPLVADFRNWPSWSPWEKMDPDMKRTYSGPQGGVGAVYAWDGNDQVGAGRMEITGMSVPGSVDIKLDFTRPFESNNKTQFRFEPQGADTQVTWNMSGPMPFISKLMSVFVSMDSMIGPDFEKGLAQMKTMAEQPAAAPSTAPASPPPVAAL
ncbi:MAG TPA: SRPBCC family protein [Telluria sp.]|nr:SRPBCC family protein [Telluria sp.]